MILNFKIEDPYNMMLSQLETVPGYNEFVRFLEKRSTLSLDWKSEIKGLYEINKKEHPLIKIASQEDSQPEGYFKYGNNLTGIIETAYIYSYTHDNPNYIKLINTLKYHCLTNKIKQIMDSKHSEYEITVFVQSLEENLSLKDINYIKKNIVSLSKKENEISIITKIGKVSITSYNKNIPINCSFPDGEAVISFTKNGIIEHGDVIDINSKIESIIKRKRKQHKKKFGDTLKVYYLNLDCHSGRFRHIDTERIKKKVKENEIVVVSPNEIRMEEDKKIIIGANKYNLNFHNEYVLK